MRSWNSSSFWMKCGLIGQAALLSIASGAHCRNSSAAWIKRNTRASQGICCNAALMSPDRQQEITSRMKTVLERGLQVGSLTGSCTLPWGSKASWGRWVPARLGAADPSTLLLSAWLGKSHCRMVQTARINRASLYPVTPIPIQFLLLKRSFSRGLKESILLIWEHFNSIVSVTIKILLV